MHGAQRLMVSDAPDQGSGAGLARYCLDNVWYWPSSVDGVVWFSAPAPKTMPSAPTATSSAGCFSR